MAGGPTLNVKPATPFLAFLTDAASIDAIKAYALAHGWPEDCVHLGGVATAVVYLKENKTPEYLLVEVPSAAEAPALLDQLAEICEPNVKLLVCGKVNEFSFYSWLMEIGAYNYLLEPITALALEGSFKKNAAAKLEPDEKKHGTVIACMGARGGVGTTTVINNLAHLIASDTSKKVVLLDVDPYFGTVAMGFDVEPARELHTLFENPERIDGLFLDRILIRMGDKLHLLSAEEPLKEIISAKAEAAEMMLNKMREKYDIILVDVPRALTPLTRAILTNTDRLLVVTELTLLSLRDAMRLHDYMKDTLKKPLPIIVANRIGLAPKHEISQADYEKHYGRALEVSVPYTLEAFAAAGEGNLLVKITKNASIISAYKSLVTLITGDTIIKEAPKKKLGFLGKVMVKGS